MTQVFNANDKDTLVSSQRHEQLDIHRVMSHLPILPYHLVADIGCGPGYFTIPLAKILFDGKVYAVDTQKEMLDAAREAIDRVHLTNVELVHSQSRRLRFEKNHLDGALVAFVLHEAKDARTMLKQVYQSLRKGGWLALMEWHKKEEEDGPPVEHRIEEAEAREMAEMLGFRFTSRHQLNSSQYMLLMRK